MTWAALSVAALDFAFVTGFDRSPANVRGTLTHASSLVSCRHSGRQLAALGFDIGAPIGVYYQLHGPGVANLVALGVCALLPGLGVVWTLITKRRADGVALLVLATIVASIGLSLIARLPISVVPGLAGRCSR